MIIKGTKSFLGEINKKYADKTILVVTHNYIIENNISDKEQINDYIHKNDEIKVYNKI